MVEDTLGARLRRAMRQKGVRNLAVAAAADVHPNTVSKWLSDSQVPDAEALDAVAELLGVSPAWLRYGDEAGASPGPADVPPPPSPELSQRVRILLAEFYAALTRAGASEEEIDSYRRFLSSPDRFSYNVGGRVALATEEQVLRELRGLMEGIQKQQKERGRKVILPSVP